MENTEIKVKKIRREIDVLSQERRTLENYIIKYKLLAQEDNYSSVNEYKSRVLFKKLYELAQFNKTVICTKAINNEIQEIEKIINAF